MPSNTRTLTLAEIVALIEGLPRSERLLAALVLFTGRRVAECVKLRVRDVGPGCIYRHDRHGMLCGIDMLPPAIEVPLGEQLEGCIALFERDRAIGAVVDVPDGLYEGDEPAESWRWRYLFAGPLAHHAGGLPVRRPHAAAQFRLAFGRALAASGIDGAFTPQALIHAHQHHAVTEVIADLNGSRPIGGRPQVVSLEARRTRGACARSIVALCRALSDQPGVRGQHRP